MKNPAYTLITKAVNMRQYLVNTSQSQRNDMRMLRLISEFKKYANYWKQKPEALRKYLLRKEAEFNQLIPPTPQGDSLKNQFHKIIAP